MASLMEELITTLEAEAAIYEEIIPVSEEKTKAIVSNDLEKLQSVTDIEKALVDQAGMLEHKRLENVKNIGVVMGKSSEELTLTKIIDFLQKQPEEQERLRAVHDRLKDTMARLKDINAQNKKLIESSLEMVEFNMNVLRSTRMSSGSGNYTKNASEMDAGISQSGMFDAKQ